MEFLTVYSFVLLIFVIFFMLITSQRASSLAQQQYAQLQLQAQNIADVINEAVGAGNGFSATVSLQSAVSSSVPYNLSVSDTGVVIAKEKVGNQVITAYAFSIAKSLSINGTLLSNGNGYLIPTASGIMKVVNSHGTIFVDSAPAATLQLPYSITVDQLQHVKVASFDGVNSYIGTGTSGLPLGNSPRSVFAWVYFTGLSGGGCTSYHGTIYSYGAESDHQWSTLRTCNDGAVSFSGYDDDFTSTFTPAPNTWYFVGYTYAAGTTNTVTLYMDGQSQTSNLGQALSTALPSSNSAEIGAYSNPPGTFFQGSISNLQVYGTALTVAQASQLYKEGITGIPVSTANLVGWWPLNGNTNDYSGSVNNGVPTNMIYNGTVSVLAHLSMEDGADAANVLVGGVTRNGTFNQTSMSSFTAYTNSTGFVQTYITAPNVSRLDFTLFGFNGNNTIQGNLKGWWPLEEGYGNSIYDLSTNGNNGVFNAPFWAPLAYQTNFAVADFNGMSSTISTGTNNFPAGSSPSSFFTWVYATATPSQYGALFAYGVPEEDYEMAALALSSTGALIFADSVNTGVTFGAMPVSLNAWHFVGWTYDGRNNLTLYVDGASNSYNMPQQNVVLNSQRIPHMGSFYGAGFFLSGMMSNAQLYNTALTTAQVSHIYAEGIAGSPIGNSGLAGWWPLAHTAEDYSGNGNNGTASDVIYSNAAYATSIGAVRSTSFNGSSSYISVPSAGVSFNGQSAISVAAWVDPSTFRSDPDFSTIVAKSNAYYLQLDSEGRPASFLNGIDSEYLHSPIRIKNNTWSQVALTYNGSAETLYINGKAVNSIAVSGTISDTAGSYLGIGANLNYAGNLYLGYNRRFDGLISDVQVYHAPLTAQQIQQLYLQGFPLYDRLNVTFG